MEMRRSRGPASGESGQAVTEYILVLVVLVAAYMSLMAMISKLDLGAKLMSPIVDSFSRVYKYGHPKAKGFDEGTPENHPRAVLQGKVRLFINPR
jgi:hypothetical protein